MISINNEKDALQKLLKEKFGSNFDLFHDDGAPTANQAFFCQVLSVWHAKRVIGVIRSSPLGKDMGAWFVGRGHEFDLLRDCR